MVCQIKLINNNNNNNNNDNNNNNKKKKKKKKDFTKTLLFLKMESLLAELRIPNVAVCGVEVGNVKLF